MNTTTRRIFLLLLTDLSLLASGCNIPIVPIVHDTGAPATGEVEPGADEPELFKA